MTRLVAIAGAAGIALAAQAALPAPYGLAVAIAAVVAFWRGLERLV